MNIEDYVLVYSVATVYGELFILDLDELFDVMITNIDFIHTLYLDKAEYTIPLYLTSSFDNKTIAKYLASKIIDFMEVQFIGIR